MCLCKLHYRKRRLHATEKRLAPHRGRAWYRLGMAGDFAAYVRRRERMRALERVLEAAKEVFGAVSNRPGGPDVWEALAKLKRAVHEADQLPPMHVTERDS